MGTFYPGMKVNPLDLSPNYAGSLMAVTNGIGALTGVAAPTFVGYMVGEVCIGAQISFISGLKFNSFVMIRNGREHHLKDGDLYFGLHLAFLLLQPWSIRFGHRVKCNHGIIQDNVNHPNSVIQNSLRVAKNQQLVAIISYKLNGKIMKINEIINSSNSEHQKIYTHKNLKTSKKSYQLIYYIA